MATTSAHQRTTVPAVATVEIEAATSAVGTVTRSRQRPSIALVLAIAWMTVLTLAAIVAPLLPLGEHVDTVKTLRDPGFGRPDLFSSHPLGTNAFGLDLLARVIYGARGSLTVAATAVTISLVVGGSLGLISGYLGGKVDLVIRVLTNTLLAFPSLILLIALASVLEPNLRNMSLSLAVLSVPTMVRLARANTLAFAQREFVLVAKAMGARTRRIIWRELMPNVVLPLASYAMTVVALLIIAESSLSFLGLGIQAPHPSWGNMIAEGQNGVLEEHPHIVIVPGVVLFVTVAALNIIGDAARARFAPAAAEVA